MKRGADVYITKDSEPDDEVEEIVPEEGFRKADETILATRKIRALPKRSMTGTPPLTPASDSFSASEVSPSPSSTPKFNGFSGFGTTSGAFSFKPPQSPSSKFPTTISSLSSSFPTSSTPSTTPAVAPGASSTAKAFASFIGDSSTTQSKSVNSTDAVSRETSLYSTQSPNTEDSVAINYYKSLRGLNLSLLSAITKAISDDPFNDVAEVLERYKLLRLNVRNEFDECSKVSTTTPIAAPSKPTSMPAPPSTFSGFRFLDPKSAPISGSNSSFVPTPSAVALPTSGFTFPAPTPATPTSVFSFSTPPASQSGPQASTSPFSPSSTAFGTSLFNSSTSSPFGTSSIKTRSPPSLTSSDTKPTSASNPFGVTPSSNTDSLISEKSSPLRSFAIPPPQSESRTFGGIGFGKPGGTVGNPVGFGFGSQSIIESESLGDTEKASNPEDTKDQGVEGETKSSPIGSMFATSPHDEEGEGEEQEDTIYAVKLKAYRLKKENEKGGTGWTELGYGVLRLKKHKETEARRLLLRNSSSGKININFNIYSGLKPSQVKKTLTFIGHDNGVSQTYNVRLQNEEQAVKLKEALEKEIASVKSNSGS
ncbi:hypothetical protein BDZ94DRAFT_1224134 [Collybia nuda]|uniref:RanBD1 domain-containing protein n=1 Tax=Collybia nuda TaxID=64659 RepID=A0A9P5Y1W4_9AGAR|nr:hypothetical protein BDZ94DRAFT_1224134 [Collybia nuda]